MAHGNGCPIWNDPNDELCYELQYERELNRPAEMWYPRVWYINPNNIFEVDEPDTPKEFRMCMRQRALSLCYCAADDFPAAGGYEDFFWISQYHDWFGDWLHLRHHPYLHCDDNYHRTMRNFVIYKIDNDIPLKSYEYLYYHHNGMEQ